MDKGFYLLWQLPVSLNLNWKTNCKLQSNPNKHFLGCVSVWWFLWPFWSCLRPFCDNFCTPIFLKNGYIRGVVSHQKARNLQQLCFEKENSKLQSADGCCMMQSYPFAHHQTSKMLKHSLWQSIGQIQLFLGDHIQKWETGEAEKHILGFRRSR